MRRNSTTMVTASSVAAVVAIPVVVAATLLFLPGADAAIKTAVCGPNNAAITGCTYDVFSGTGFELDCANAKSTLLPTGLLGSGITNIKVCKGTSLREDATTACSEEEKLENIPGVANGATTTDGWKADYTSHDESTDLIVSGACTANANGFYFNFVLKATTTTGTPSNNSATSAFGLATASSVALLGLVVAAA